MGLKCSLRGLKFSGGRGMPPEPAVFYHKIGLHSPLPLNKKILYETLYTVIICIHQQSKLLWMTTSSGIANHFISCTCVR